MRLQEPAESRLDIRHHYHHAHVSTLTSDLFPARFFAFIRENFDWRDHLFIARRIGAANIGERNVMPAVFADDMERIAAALQACDQIWIHGLFSFNLSHLLDQHSELAERTVWIVFGSEVHTPSNPELDLMRRRIAARCRGIIVFTEDDYQGFIRKFGKPRWHAMGFMPNPIRMESLDLVPPPDDSVPRILIGHCSSQQSNHIPTLRQLAGILTGDARIMVPLSYGKRDYAEEVTRLGNSLFGDRFEVLHQLLAPDEYGRLLSQIDVALMPQVRQSGLSTIYALLYTGARLFTASRNIRRHLWTQFRVHTHKLDHLNASHLKRQTNREACRSVVANVPWFDQQWLAELWQKIFHLERGLECLNVRR